MNGGRSLPATTGMVERKRYALYQPAALAGILNCRRPLGGDNDRCLRRQGKMSTVRRVEVGSTLVQQVNNHSIMRGVMIATRTFKKPSRLLPRALACSVGLSMAFTALAQADGDGIESKWTKVDGGKVHYLQAGPKTGVPILLLHGGRFQAETWRKTRTLKVFSNAGYYVAAVDLPGFGKTPSAKTEPGVWLGKLIVALDLDRPVLVSPSMSGRFSMPFVVEHSDRLRAFVAVAPVSVARHERALSRISVPLLAIWGERDKVIPLAHADLLVKHAPHCRKVIVPKAGHALYMDDAASFHKELLKFFGELKTP